MINADICAENVQLRKEIHDMKEKLASQGELSKHMRGNFMKELAMLRGAHEIQTEKMTKQAQDFENQLKGS